VSDLQQETVIDWLKAKHKELMDTGQWGNAATIEIVMDIIEGKIK